MFDLDGAEHSSRSRFTLASAPELQDELRRLVAQAADEAERGVSR